MAGRERGLDGMTSRRRFLQQGLATAVAFVAVGCTGRSRAHTRRTTTTTAPLDYFGGRIDAGTFEAVRASVTSSGSPRYVAAARAYVSPFPPELADKARGVYPAEVLPLLAAGVVVLYQRCTHLGCRVPFCRVVAVVRVPVPRREVRPRRRAPRRARRRADWIS